jgi:hypothetical protein
MAALVDHRAMPPRVGACAARQPRPQPASHLRRAVAGSGHAQYGHAHM